MATIDDVISEVLLPRQRKKDCDPIIVRPLAEGDFIEYYNSPPKAKPVITVQRLRHTHHMVARLIAEGEKDVEVSVITGYNPAYISNLKRDPAFQQLLQYYSEQKAQAYADVHERLAALATDTVEVLQERLATAPDGFSSRELMTLAELTLDRSGYGPTTRLQHTGAVALLTPEQLERLKNDVVSSQQGTIRALSSDHSRTIMGEVLSQGAVEEAALEGDEGKGDGLSAEAGPGTSSEVP